MLDAVPLISFLYLLGASQAAFLAFALLTSKVGQPVANRYLAAYTLVFCIALIDDFFDSTGLSVRYVQLDVLLWPKEFLYGVLIYFYTRELIEPGRFRLQGAQWLHFLPALLHVLATWPLLLFSGELQAAVLAGRADGSVTGSETERWWALALNEIEVVLSVIHIGTYIVLSLGLLRGHRRRIKDTFSYTEKVCFDWLRNLLIGTLCVYSVWLIGLVVVDDSDLMGLLLSASMVLLIFTMAYMGLRQPLIFSGSAADSAGSEQAVAVSLDDQPETIHGTIEQINASAESAPKYQNSALSQDMSQALLDELETHMRSARPYLDAQLSLPQLAESLSVSVNYLSQVINQQRGENFFDFVNSFRVSEACTILADPGQDHRTVLDIALASGFNSKSAFYSAFKKSKGITPGQFRKEKRVELKVS